MKRRQLLKRAGVGGAVLTAGGIGLTLQSDVVAAASYDISGTKISSDDGDVKYIDLDARFRGTWDGFDVPVAAVGFIDKVVNPSTGAEKVLFDQRGVDQQPVEIANYSSKDSSGDYGGDDEYASEDPDTYVEATGPSTAGFVNAAINWRILDDEGSNAKSIEDPGDTDNFDIDNPNDDSTKKTTLKLTKDLRLYSFEDTGRQSRATQAGNTVYLLGNDDGTVGEISAESDFNVNVTNEPATTTANGSGSTSGE